MTPIGHFRGQKNKEFKISQNPSKIGENIRWTTFGAFVADLGPNGLF